MIMTNFKTMYLISAAALFVFCIAAAREAPGPAQEAGDPGRITRAQWIALAKKRIYFGHMSVGNGLMAGVREIMQERGNARLKIVESGSRAAFKPATLAHSGLGRNGDAISKIEAFRDMFDSGYGHGLDIALFKLCYVDIVADTDIKKIFSHYKQTMDELQRKYPQVKFAHMTVPLRTVQTGWKAAVKKALYLPVRGYADNIRRNEYNEMLRREYGPAGRLFDLAEIESTYQNGIRSKFISRNTVYYSLAADKTDDGGHLNSAGRKTAAEEFLKFLAGLK